MVVVPMTLDHHLRDHLFEHQVHLQDIHRLLAVPFSLIGVFWLMWLLGYNMSIAVWVGIIALAGVSAETGVVMLLYLDVAYEDASEKAECVNRKDLVEAVYHGAVNRVRPKMMTAVTTMAGLLPSCGAHGTGSRCDEENCHSHGGWNGELRSGHSGRLSSHLLHLERLGAKGRT